MALCEHLRPPAPVALYEQLCCPLAREKAGLANKNDEEGRGGKLEFTKIDFGRATSEQIRRAAKKCKKRMAKHPGEAMGMRQTILLPEEALEALATLLEIFEGTGELPEQIQMLVVKLLELEP